MSILFCSLLLPSPIVRAEETCSWPPHIKLDVSKMEEVDGREEKTRRFRPWPSPR